MIDRKNVLAGNQQKNKKIIEIYFQFCKFDIFKDCNHLEFN